MRCCGRVGWQAIDAKGDGDSDEEEEKSALAADLSSSITQDLTRAKTELLKGAMLVRTCP